MKKIFVSALIFAITASHAVAVTYKCTDADHPSTFMIEIDTSKRTMIASDKQSVKKSLKTFEIKNNFITSISKNKDDVGGEIFSLDLSSGRFVSSSVFLGCTEDTCKRYGVNLVSSYSEGTCFIN